jgi:aspartate 4-decarboxylase
MTLFAAFALLDRDQSYKERTRGIVNGRLATLYEGMGVRLSPDSLRAGYYAEIDLMGWALRRYGSEFAAWLTASHEPIDPVVRLAERAGVVLLHGGGFEGPAWSVRVSLANLDDDCYLEVGAAITRIFDGYVDEWRATTVRLDTMHEERSTT